MLVMLNKIHEAKSTMTGGPSEKHYRSSSKSPECAQLILMAWRPLPPNKGYSRSSKACACDQIAVISKKRYRLCFSSSCDYFMHSEITEETEVFCDE